MVKIIDKSEGQKNAKASIRGFNGAVSLFVVAAQTTIMPIILTDAKVARNPIVFVNNSFLALTAYARDVANQRAESSCQQHPVDRAINHSPASLEVLDE